MNCIIKDLNNEGEGVTRINDIVTFVPYSCIGDELDIDIVSKEKSFYYGKINKVVKPSEKRINPLCPYYHKCGGCNLMHMMYDEELKYKTNKVINNLNKIAKIDIKDIDIIGSDSYGYRNHSTFIVSGNKIGFNKYHTNEIVDINTCLISNDKINKTLLEIRNFINIYKNNNINSISIKGYDDILINIYSDDFNLINEFKSLVNYDSLYINNILVDKDKNAVITLGNYKYKVSNDSFFQKNTSICKKLYDYIKENVYGNVLDLYCGVGSIGIYVSDKVDKVLGIEINKKAVENALENAKLNNIKNIDFICGKTEDNLSNISNIDTIIVDPPRSGINKKGINDILNINPSRIIYVSCNSTTLARDINLLKEDYVLKEIKLFDMFFNTSHVETVCILERK